MTGVKNQPAYNNKPIWYFIACWTLLNILQACTLEIHADEAYYWLYSRFLDWGYFDHPPMAALFIKAGYALFQNEFGARLLTIICSSAGLYILWLIARQYAIKPIWFILITSCLFILHIYGFTSTPDVPLLFFTILFYYIVKQYLEADGIKLAFLLAIIIACLLYSKYHGLLLVIFTVLANPALFKRKSFWLIAILSLILFIPHIWWQVSNGYPSLNFHLFDRSAARYKLHYTTDYPLLQLAMSGPFMGWFIFYSAFKNRITDSFKRTLVVNAAGIFLFFLLNTLKGKVEAHWPLIGYVPLLLLSLIYINTSHKNFKWLKVLAIVNVGFILLVRFAVMIGFEPIKKFEQIKSYFGFKEWAHLVKQKAGNSYVVMSEGFQNPSKYDFYNNTTKGFSYDARDYRLTQFDLLPLEERMQHKRVYLLSGVWNTNFTTDTITCTAGTWYGGWIEDFRTYQKIKIDAGIKQVTAKPEQTLQFDLLITNPYPYTVNFTNQNVKHAVVLETCFFERRDAVDIQATDNSFNNIVLKSGGSTHFKVTAKAPFKKGTYDLFFSIRTHPFNGSRNSHFIKLIVE
ncbi:ArnT family glycosyltransferase [Mucilaginibacter litoreus]|uniref:ArnT family glycosyltransferase n=1 Tax=Mucilaginibacter litoreus TaxID=1048221 RepID=A0ABW3AR51_9SPHI